MNSSASPANHWRRRSRGVSPGKAEAPLLGWKPAETYVWNARIAPRTGGNRLDNFNGRLGGYTGYTADQPLT